MNKYLPVALIVIGLALGAYGFMQYGDSGASLSVGDISVSATDEGGRALSYITMGLGVISLLVGGALIAKSK